MSWDRNGLGPEECACVARSLRLAGYATSIRLEAAFCRFVAAKSTAFIRPPLASSPQVNAVSRPALHAYSHSASAGKRNGSPSTRDSQLTYCCASFQLTHTTG